MLTKLRAIARRGAPSLRNVVFSHFGYWPVSSLQEHWISSVPVYCISLSRAVKRREVIESQARTMNLRELHMVPAVDAKTLDYTALVADGRYDPEESKRWHRNGLTINEIACSLSHAECYRRIITAGHERAIVIEDDALFRARRLRELAVGDIPEWAEIVFLNAFFARTPPSRHLQGTVFGDDDYAGSAAAYMITQETARKLLKVAIPVVHAADGLLGRALTWADDSTHEFRRKGCDLQLRSVLIFPEAVTNGSTEHYYRSSLR